MMINKITTSVEYNYWLKHLDILLNEPTNQNSVEVTKVVKPTNNKTIIKLEDWCNKQPNIPFILQVVKTKYGGCKAE